MRTDWVRRLVDATQVLGGAVAGRDPETVEAALVDFTTSCPQPATTAERLVLRGILLDAFIRLDAGLEEHVPADERHVAEALMRHATPSSTIAEFVGAVRELIAAARRMRSLPLPERARRWISEHFDGPQSLGEIAAVLGAHPRTLARQFRRRFGIGIQQYRNDCRAARAAELMSGSDLTIDAVAAAVGVRSKTTLYRILRQSGRLIERRAKPKPDEQEIS